MKPKVLIIKKTIYFLILILFISCKTDNKIDSKIIKDVKTKKQTKEKELNTNIKYVIAKSGLNFRKNPKGKIIGKFEFGQEVTIIKHTNIFENIKDENELINGEWLGVTSKNNSDIVYVFGSFITDKNTFEKISKNFNQKNKFSHDELIGKNFYIYDDTNNTVNDYTFTKGPDLMFHKTEVIETRVMENIEHPVRSSIYENGFIIYNKDKYPLKFKYNKSKGILTQYHSDITFSKYIDSTIVFKKGSKIKYNYIPESTFADEYTIDYTDFRKENSEATDERIMPYTEWIEENQTLLDSVIGDINNDNIQDGIYYTVDDNFNTPENEDNESEVTTIILLGTDEKGKFKLYHKSKTIVPGFSAKYYTNYETFGSMNIKRENPFWENSLEKGVLQLNIDYEDTEGENLVYYFTFKYKNNNLILTKVSKSYMNNESEFFQKLNSPSFDLKIQEFDVYKFMNIYSFNN